MSNQSSKSETTIEFEFYGRANLKVEDVWVDGDPPEAIDATSVAELIHRDGGVMGVLNDWALLNSLGLVVTVTTPNPDYKGDDVLFPEFRPEPLLTTSVEIMA